MSGASRPEAKVALNSWRTLQFCDQQRNSFSPVTGSHDNPPITQRPNRQHVDLRAGGTFSRSHAHCTCAQNMVLAGLGELDAKTCIYRLSLTARDTFSVVSPRPWPSSSSMAKRLSLSAARPSTSPASSSAQSVRPSQTAKFDRINRHSYDLASANH